MSTFIAAFVVLLGFFFLMSIGYLVKRQAVAGSCGGLGALGRSEEHTSELQSPD